MAILVSCPLAGNTRRLFEILLLFNSVTSAFVMRSVNVSDKRQTNWWICSFVTPTAALSKFLQFTRSDRTEIRISKDFKTV